MFKKIKDWFIGLKDKVIQFFTKTVKEDVEVNFGGLTILWILAALEVGHIIFDVTFKLIPWCLKVNFFLTTIVVVSLIGILVSLAITNTIWAILNPRVSAEWRVAA